MKRLNADPFSPSKMRFHRIGCSAKNNNNKSTKNQRWITEPISAESIVRQSLAQIIMKANFNIFYIALTITKRLFLTSSKIHSQQNSSWTVFIICPLDTKKYSDTFASTTERCLNIIPSSFQVVVTLRKTMWYVTIYK